MHPIYDEFVSYLNAEDKEKCVQLALARLQDRAIDVITLYNEILTPAMYADFCPEKEQEICVWKEHVRTSIVRTVIECSYPYIIGEKNKKYGPSYRGKVVTVCPPGELHDLGARMVADFFTLCGYDVTFTGANVPQDNIIKAIRYANPAYVAISVTNYYNLVATRKLIAKIQETRGDAPFQVILGGQACQGNHATCEKMGADMILDTFEDIERLGKG
jgi:methanogenic corrinoid protein MtbC1